MFRPIRTRSEMKKEKAKTIEEVFHLDHIDSSVSHIRLIALHADRQIKLLLSNTISKRRDSILEVFMFIRNKFGHIRPRQDTWTNASK